MTIKLKWFGAIKSKDPYALTLQVLYEFIEAEMAVRTRFNASSNQDPRPPKQQDHRPSKGRVSLSALHVSTKPAAEAAMLACFVRARNTNPASVFKPSS